MAKITRYSGNLKAFGSAAQGTERTVFGGTAQSDLLTDNVDASFLRGWGIVPVSGNPTKQDFNALGFTVSQMLAYLHQQGVAEWDAAQEYNVDAIVVIGSAIYISKTNANIGNPPVTDSGANWTHATARANMPQGLQRVSTSLPADYQLQTWSDALEDGHYSVTLTVAQNGLPSGRWLIDVHRDSTDAPGNEYRVITAKSTGNGNTANQRYISSDTLGVWTPFVNLPTFSTGQVWQDFTALRVDGVTYTNSTGGNIEVLISVVSLSCIPVVGGLPLLPGSGLIEPTTGRRAISFPVPAGATYKILGISSGWMELR